MAKQQVVLTADSTQIKDVIDYIILRNRHLKIGEKKIDVHFVTPEELIERVNDAVIESCINK
jgi:uncharacterized iron-regulated protein